MPSSVIGLLVSSRIFSENKELFINVLEKIVGGLN